MADKPKENKPLLPNKSPRGNYQMWVILGILALVLGIMYLNKSGTLKEIGKGEFEQMLQDRSVKKIALIEDQKVIEITLKQDALNNAKYRDVLEKNSFGSN